MYRETLEVFDFKDYHSIDFLHLSWKFSITVVKIGKKLRVCSDVSFIENDCILSDAESIKTIRFLAQKDGFDDIDVSIKGEAPNEQKFDVVELDRNVFATEGKIYIKLIVSIDDVAGPQVSSIDFLRPSNLSDVVLIVEGQKLYANKGYLATCSKMFEEMLYSDPEKKEFKLDGVEWNQFYDLLQQIYPGPDIFHYSNIDYLMELAGRFDIPKVAEDVKQYLKRVSHPRLDTTDKIAYADKYNMFDALSIFISKLDERSFVQVKNYTFFEKVTQQTKDALYERGLELDSLRKRKKMCTSSSSSEDEMY